MQLLRNRILIFSIVLLCVEQINAQSPVFTDTAFAPQAGDQYTVNNAQYISPGFAGANQTWDFSPAITMGTATYLVTGVGAIPCGSQYPTATLGIGTGGYEMIQRTWNEYNVVGTTITPGQANFIYSDPETRFKFPMNFNTTYSDLYAGVSNVAQTVYRSGFVLVSCDGYGTVITPTTSYSNALRFHRTAIWTDSSSFGSDTCTGDYYYWFAPGNRYPVAQIWLVNCTGGNSSGAMFLDSSTIGMEETVSSSFNVFPNPFTNSLNVTCTQNFIGQTAVIRDMFGRAVQTFVITNTSVIVDLNELSNGVYFLCVDERRTTRVVKMSE
jgi:hypothetical protein